MIVFDTPGLIDLRAFTLMGVSAKPKSTNPIGYFGTGLKYAVATLVRLGAEPVLWIGQDKYTFFKRSDEFRGAEFEGLSMRKERSGWALKATIIDLPYALTYGRNWEAWMAFRELESNTLDEGGSSYQVEADPGPPAEGTTRIVVDLSDFDKAWERREEIFLPESSREGSGVQVVEGESSALYYRGLKVYKTPKPCVTTYNFLDHLTLTEDRTLAWEYTARLALGNWLLKQDDEELIERVLTAGSDHWEHGIEFDANTPPSRAFHNVAMRHPKNMAPAFHGYYARHDERIVEETYNAYDAHPLPWKIEGNSVVDAKGTQVFDAPYQYQGKWDLLAGAILKMINQLAPADTVEVPDEPVGDGDAYDEVDEAIYAVPEPPPASGVTAIQ